MIRTQIQLSDEQTKRIKEVAAREGRSMADVIRESVDAWLDSSPPARNPRALREEALAIAGRFASGVRDLSQKHDAYLAEDLAK